MDCKNTQQVNLALPPQFNADNLAFFVEDPESRQGIFKWLANLFRPRPVVCVPPWFDTLEAAYEDAREHCAGLGLEVQRFQDVQEQNGCYHVPVECGNVPFTDDAQRQPSP
jgi:hypothetical protein